MALEILESDWKQLRPLHTLAVERHCQQTLDLAQGICSDSSKNAHQRYLDLFELIQDRDGELALFNDLRRSNALIQLCAARVRNLITEQEFSRFSPETRNRIDILIS